MANRATLAFTLSIIGATYQIVSPALAVLVDSRTSLYFLFNLTNSFVSILVTFWAVSHLLEDWKGRATWPAIILAIAIANLSGLIIAFFFGVSNSGGLPVNTNQPLMQFLVLLPGPLFSLVGSLVGFAAVRQYSREHGRVIVHQP